MTCNKAVSLLVPGLAERNKKNSLRVYCLNVYGAIRKKKALSFVLKALHKHSNCLYFPFPRVIVIVSVQFIW